ncbi:spore germination lipoprotein GerD [Paenibacillus sacheonensis]|uniref:Spore gernimation protein n=1 Tax=Paenibacillus sacheonensis TaxID=742054 RepID=A0A7X4YVD1_9BACL|nr:spore germination lipoprotein GerD [Paenibacillus sacheonensis]MBM7569368.1 spore germination protein D [Paenibacillus sacheonensis]NBC73301.1 spore gernimation protein [Paenibacillus sacheonensis]
MIKRIVLMGTAIIISSMLSSCGSEPSSAASEPISYKDMKSMVIDILKTEDAQKALQESAISTTGNTGMTSKLLTVQDQENVKLAVKETLVSPEYNKVIEKMMTDPRFAGEFAQAVNKQNKQIHKDLLKDPTYQKDMISAMKSPEMDKMILEVLQSTQYRKQVMTIMQESMQSPIFRLEILDLMKKAVQEELKPKPDEKVTKSKDGGEGDQGGDSGGEGGDGGDQSDSGMGEQGGG